MRRRLRELAVLVAVGGLMMAGCSSSDKKASVTDAQGKNVAESQSQDEGSKKVTFVLKSLGSNYWVQLKAGAVDKAEELGIDLEVLAPSSDNATEDQIRMLEDQVVSGVDLVLVAPSNSGAQVATFDKVVDAGIPLICVDTNAKDYDKKTSFIGSSNEEVGKKAGEYLTENVKDKSGAVILLRGQLGDETADTRSKGCTDALKAAGFSNIVEQPANNDRNTAMGVMENMLQSNDNIVAVYATNDEMALGAARALQAANDKDTVVVGTNADGLMGENGAGKSTLIKLLTGAYKPDEGEMLLDGQPLKVNGPKDAMNMGLTAIYQELNVIPKLTVWENIFLGRELRNKKGLLDIPQMKERAKELLQQLRQNIDVDEKVENLGMGHQQMVEICKALVLESRLIIMDEPTSSLSAGETEELLRTARELRDRGMAIVFISHHMDEIFRICDRLTVLRDGCVIQSMLAKDTNTENLIKLMVGRDINQQFPKIVAAKKEELLRIEDFTSEDGSFKDISFSVCGGEVLGFAGLVGAGRTEVMRAIFGADARKTGKVYVKGKEADIRSPKAAISYGIAFLTEDRKGEGLVLSNTVGFNINLSTFEKSKRGLLLNNALLRNKAKNDITQLRIKTPSINTTVRGLSGGNQQKVVIAKWLETNADIFIMDEPTRGLDVGAKLEVYNIINNLVSEGKAVIMVSSELPEVMGMSDRIIVMHEGYMAGEFKRDEVEREAIMMAASGGEQNDRYSNDNG